MIPAVYHTEFWASPGQHEQHPLVLVVESNSMDVFHCFLPYCDAVLLLPLIHSTADLHEMQPVCYVKFHIHQYRRGGNAWLSTYLRQRFLAADFLIFLRVVGLM